MGGTRREGPVGAGTRREGIGDAPDYVRVNLPPGLAERFRVVASLGSGGEADVLLVNDEQGAPFVVKLYRPGLSFDEAATSLLAGADPAHVVRSVEPPGQAPDGSRYEVLEHCGPGSLRQVMARGDGLDVTGVVAELCEALDHIHALRLPDDPHARLVHQDLKPENVLVRSTDPLDLVLGDFGLARMIAASVHFSRREQGTRPWRPPSGQALSTGWDWWALGMIVAEIAAGDHPFAPDGVMLPEEAISDLLSQHPVDLSGVGDARVRRLCEGLLARRTAARWGAEQVRRWLAGDDVPVEADTGSGVPSRRRHRVVFGGRGHDRAAALAPALQDNWDRALEVVIQRSDGGALSQQISLLLAAEGLTGALELLKDVADPPARLANLLVEMHPALLPIYRGKDVRPAAIAGRLTDPRTAAAEVELIEGPRDGLVSTGILLCWQSLDGMDEAVPVTDRLREAQAFLRSHQKILMGMPSGRVAAKAAVYAAAIDPAQGAAHQERLAGPDMAAARQQPWWQELAESPGPYAAVLALATEPLAREETEAERAKAELLERSRRQAEEQERRQEEAAAVERRRQVRQEADAEAAAGRRKLVAGGALALLLLLPLLVGWQRVFLGGPSVQDDNVWVSVWLASAGADDWEVMDGLSKGKCPDASSSGEPDELRGGHLPLFVVGWLLSLPPILLLPIGSILLWAGAVYASFLGAAGGGVAEARVVLGAAAVVLGIGLLLVVASGLVLRWALQVGGFAAICGG